MAILKASNEDFLKDSEFVLKELVGSIEVDIDGDPAELYYNQEGAPILDVIYCKDVNIFRFRNSNNEYIFSKNDGGE